MSQAITAWDAHTKLPTMMGTSVKAGPSGNTSSSRTIPKPCTGNDQNQTLMEAVLCVIFNRVFWNLANVLVGPAAKQVRTSLLFLYILFPLPREKYVSRIQKFCRLKKSATLDQSQASSSELFCFIGRLCREKPKDHVFCSQMKVRISLSK